MSCQMCGVSSAGGQFCVSCGQPLPSVLASTATALEERDLRERPEPARNPWLAFQEIRLVACPRCGAPNSAARWQCARCCHTFDETEDAEPAAETTGPVEGATGEQAESAPWLMVITAVVGLAAVAVALAMLASRGVGPFGSDGDQTVVTPVTEATVDGATASGAANGGAAAALIDDDTRTAWRSDGDGAWVELTLGEAVQIDHLLVWNGDQHNADTFAEAGRARAVNITFPDVGKAYTAEFADRKGNFRVDMIDPPVAKRIRIEVIDVHNGDAPVAISEVEALVANGGTDE